MKANLLNFAAALIIALAAGSSAADVKKPGDQKLITFVERVSPGLFKEAPGNEGASSNRKPLPPTAEGMQRWDVSKYLTDRGVVMAPDSDAIFIEELGVMVVTNTPEQIDLVERILFMCYDVFDSIKQIDVEAGLWQFDASPENQLAPKPIRFADIKKAAGDSLRRLQSISLLTKSGNRSLVVSKQGGTAGHAPPPEKPAKEGSTAETAESVLGAAKGAALIAEPVIGPDARTVDMQFDYSVRLPRGDNAPDFEMNYTTNVSVVGGQNLVVHSMSAPGERGKATEVVLIISARIIEADERTPEQRKAELERANAAWKEAMIKKAHAGLPLKK